MNCLLLLDNELIVLLPDKKLTVCAGHRRDRSERFRGRLQFGRCNGAGGPQSDQRAIEIGRTSRIATLKQLSFGAQIVCMVVVKDSIIQTVGYAGQIFDQTGLRELVLCGVKKTN